MALTKDTPDTIKATLEVMAQGVKNTLMLTYHNRTPDEYDEFSTNPENLKAAEQVTTSRRASALLTSTPAWCCLW